MPNSSSESSVPLAQSLLNAVCDLLFCPEFCVAPNKSGGGRDEAEDLQNLDSCEYIWAPGVGFANAPQNAPSYDLHRRELLRLLATCFSQSMYLPPVGEAHAVNNRWVAHFTSAENRHALPLFTSLLNLVCSYDPAGILPYNHLLFQVRKLYFFFLFWWVMAQHGSAPRSAMETHTAPSPNQNKIQKIFSFLVFKSLLW